MTNKKVDLTYPYYQGGLMRNNDLIHLFTEYSPEIPNNVNAKLPDGTVVAITGVEHIEDFFESYTVLTGWILRLSDATDTLKALKEYPTIQIYSNFDWGTGTHVKDPTKAIQVELKTYTKDESYEQTNSNSQGTESNTFFSKLRSTLRLGHKKRRRRKGSL
jgi:hypothetical protein